MVWAWAVTYTTTVGQTIVATYVPYVDYLFSILFFLLRGRQKQIRNGDVMWHNLMWKISVENSGKVRNRLLPFDFRHGWPLERDLVLLLFDLSDRVYQKIIVTARYYHCQLTSCCFRNFLVGNRFGFGEGEGFPFLGYRKFWSIWCHFPIFLRPCKIYWITPSRISGVWFADYLIVLLPQPPS